MDVPLPGGLPRICSGSEVPTHAELVAARSAALEAGFASGEYERFVWPWGLLGIYAVLAYMAMPPAADNSRLVRFARYPLWAFAVYWCVGNILSCRSYNPPLQYGIGLANSYACVWLAFHVIWRDSRTQSYRIVERAGSMGKGSSAGDEASGKSTTVDGSNGVIRRLEKDSEAKQGTEMSKRKLQTDSGSANEEYYWEGLPLTWSDRFYWVCTMVLCLRGEGTSHGIRQIPSPPTHVRESLRRNSPWMPEPAWVAAAGGQGQVKGKKRSDIFGPPTKIAAMRYYLATWAVTYLLLDLAKNLMERDRYFIGCVPITAPLPLSLPPPSSVSHFPRAGPFLMLLQRLAEHPIVAKAARLALCCGAIVALLTNLTALVPLLFCGLLGVQYQPWLFATIYGSGYVRILREAGIAGWWGRWWHQMFRASFEAAAQALWRAMPRGFRDAWRNTAAHRLLAMLVAFAISAALHAAGSATLNGPTRPWTGSGAFFLVQPLGIVLETAAREAAGRSGVSHRTPGWVKTAAALLWVHFWLYHSAPLLSDDVASGGVWTTEVVPLSVVGGLSGNRWFRWKWWMMPIWHTDEKWWKSGIAF